jgi:hypothetical protein
MKSNLGIVNDERHSIEQAEKKLAPLPELPQKQTSTNFPTESSVPVQNVKSQKTENGDVSIQPGDENLDLNKIEYAKK